MPKWVVVCRRATCRVGKCRLCHISSWSQFLQPFISMSLFPLGMFLISFKLMKIPPVIRFFDVNGHLCLLMWYSIQSILIRFSSAALSLDPPPALADWSPSPQAPPLFSLSKYFTSLIRFYFCGISSGHFWPEIWIVAPPPLPRVCVSVCKGVCHCRCVSVCKRSNCF